MTFISGPITDPNAKVKFSEAENYLIKMNHSPVNPFRINPDGIIPWPARLEILASCASIFLLTGWISSKESWFEKYYSEISGKEIMFQSMAVSDQMTNEIIIKIENAIQDVTGMSLSDYRAGTREPELFFCKMLFSKQCQKAGLEADDIAFKFIDRDRTTIMHQLKRYDDEVKYTPKFRIWAEKVNSILHPNACCNDILNEI